MSGRRFRVAGAAVISEPKGGEMDTYEVTGTSALGNRPGGTDR
jgi:hypothetical protein